MRDVHQPACADTHRLEGRSGTRRRPRRSARASSTASVWRCTCAATARAASRRPARSSSTPTARVQSVSGASNEIGSGQRTNDDDDRRRSARRAAGSRSPSRRTSTPTLTTDTGGTGGSRQTNTGGCGMYEAAMDARNAVARTAAPASSSPTPRKAEPATIERHQATTSDHRRPGLVKSATTTKKLTLSRERRPVHRRRRSSASRSTSQRRPLGAHGLRGRTPPRSRSTRSPARSRSRKYVAVHDVGRRINPFGARAADRGRRGHGAGRASDRRAAHRQGDGPAAEPEHARLQGAVDQGRARKHRGGHRREAQGVRRRTARTASASRRWARRHRPSPTPSTTPSACGSTDMPITREKVLAALKASN